MAPLVLMFLLAAWAVLPRIRLAMTGLMLLQLALVVPVAALGFLPSGFGSGTAAGPLIRYGFLGALFFLAATPLHLLVGLRFVGADRPPAWVFVLAYPLFPVAILVAAVLTPRTGQWAELRRQLRLIRRFD
jgi:hypothetical protein